MGAPPPALLQGGTGFHVRWVGQPSAGRLCLPSIHPNNKDNDVASYHAQNALLSFSQTSSLSVSLFMCPPHSLSSSPTGFREQTRHAHSSGCCPGCSSAECSFPRCPHGSPPSLKSWLNGTFPPYPVYNCTSVEGIPPSLLHSYPQNSAPAGILNVLLLFSPVCPQKRESLKVGIFVLFTAESCTQHLTKTH